MFIDEAKLAAQLNHPNITHIYDLGKLGDDYYIAMEYVEGRNLRSVLNDARRTSRPLPVPLALHIASRLANALDYAHRKRDFDGQELELVHRDVSPQNVLMSDEGDIKLCDFGISKAVAKVSQTESGALKGKIQYMSPEQAWGRPVDARSDLFSLGTLLFEMLTGQRLFTGDSEISVLEAVRECRVKPPRKVNPRVPQAVDTLVMRALERDPDRRFRTAGELRQALEALLEPMRPTPGQADLAAYLAELAAVPGPVPPPAAATPAPPAAAAGAAARAVAAPAAGVAPPSEAQAAAAEPATAGGSRSAPTEVPVLEARGPAPVEEPPARRRWLLVAVLATLAAAALLTWLLVGGSGPEAPPPARAPSEEAAPAAGPDAGGGMDAAAAAPAAAEDATADEAAADDVSIPDLEALVDERLAAEERRLRARYEEQQRRLEAELARMREAAAAEPPPAEGGEAAPALDEPEPPPPAPGAAPTPDDGPPALVSTHRPQYPSAGPSEPIDGGRRG
jgi:hypothetical protein